MGQSALIAAVLITVTMMVFLYSTQQTTIDTQELQTEAFAEETARDLAYHGRSLVLANWLESSGTAQVAPFNSVSKYGGTIEVTNYNVTSNLLDLTIRGYFDGAVHDIRSRYQWNNYSLSPFQIKAADLDIDIHQNATVDIPSITLDDQSLTELDEVLIQELGLANDLSEFGLSMNDMRGDLSTELTSTNNTSIQVDEVDAAKRAQLEQENGMFFPDQVEQVINNYINTNPHLQTSTSNSNLPTTFGLDSGDEILRVTGDLDLNGNFEGKGILIVEGSINIPPGSSFTWEGLVLIKPPPTEMNPRINFSGQVTLNGALIALHDAMPNTGHMDLTTMRDMYGTWSIPNGRDLNYQGWAYRHKHDFTSRYGNSIRYYSSSSSDRIHEYEHNFYNTLQNLSSTDEIFLEFFNPTAHGRGVLTMQLSGSDKETSPVSAGFPPSMMDPPNKYRSRKFTKDELEYLQIDITRLSSLKKMWDTGENFPGCTSIWGPICVANAADRYRSLTLRLYIINGGTESRIWEASMYWHRRTDELEDFEESMENLVDDIKSPDYGLDINFGSDVTFSSNQQALSLLANLAGSALGYVHLGTWHSHWGKDHPENPLLPREVPEVSSD